jgi:hypothetical protein
MSEFQQQLILIVHEAVNRSLHLRDLMIEDAPILSEVHCLCLERFLLRNLLPFFRIEVNDLILSLRDLLSSLSQMRGQLVFFVLLVYDFISDFH